MTARPEQVLDELLVLDAQAGDHAAFTQLVKRWQPRLWRHARLLSDDEASAWDAVQEAWSAVMRGLRALDDPADFGTWALRIVTNKCADAVRRRTRQRRLAHHAAEQANLKHRDEEREPRDADAVRAAVSSLPEILRAAVSLHYACGLTVAQVAAVLAIPAGTVKSRLSDARSKLRTTLERNEQ
ncbi:MAG: sigma-70 family RNA polymerase sigma factor [Phycisphaerae bacterium]|nr:sigma-70 family RNA polymerase sigma factor [Phycisphaerae bacterium]